MVGAEILLEIDATLDRLIQNAEAFQRIEMGELSEFEIEAFQKTQESLLHRFIHMDQLLDAKRKSLSVKDHRSATAKIEKKMKRFETLKRSYHKSLANAAKQPILSKRRKKKFL